MRLVPRSIVGRTILMALGVALIGAATSLALLFSMPPPSSPPLSLFELGRLARGLPIVNEEGTPEAHILADPGRATWPVDPDRSRLFTTLLLQKAHLAPGAARIEIGFGRRFYHSAGRLAREIRMYGPEGANPYLFDNMRLIVHRADGRWTVFERLRSQPYDTWRWLSAGWILAGLALILPIALLFADRIARPIRQFARASARLGADAQAAPIPVDGPVEIVEAATAFNRMQERIQRHLAERTTTVAAVAHDLRTPLARLRFRLERAPEPLRDKAIADLEEMEAMIAAVLRLARDEAATVPHQRIDLAPLLAEVVAGYREQGRDVALSAAAASLPIDGNPGALRRLIQNLVNNAIGFGGHARLAAVREGDTVRITVADRGPGMADVALARAFDPFWRAEGSRNRATGGTGLGLTIVQTIVQRHGGTIDLANGPDGGLVATVLLPVAEDQPKAIRSALAATH